MRQVLESQPATSKAHGAIAQFGQRNVRWLCCAILAFGLCLTAVGTGWLNGGIHQEAQADFARYADRLEQDVTRRITDPLHAMEGLRGIYATVGPLDRAGFREYVESRHISRESAGIGGFGFVQRVERKDLAAFVQSERQEGQSQFAITTTGTADDLYIVKLIEPLASNQPDWGFDLGSEPVRREAVERAIRTGRPTLSGRATLLQDKRQGAGWLLLVPVFRKGTDSAMQERHLRNLIGLIYAPISAAEILSDVTGFTGKQIDFELFDGVDVAADKLLFGAGYESRQQRPVFETRRRITFGGRELTLRVYTAAQYTGLDRLTPILAAVTGCLLSFALAWVVWLLAAGRARAVSMAQEMTTDLDRMAKVVQRTTNMVFGTDRDLQIQWVNDGFTQLTGYTPQEAHGRRASELFGHPNADPQALQRLMNAVSKGEGCRAEILNRHKCGSDFWVETEIQPSVDAGGEITGFIEIAQDITERKLAEQQLQAKEALLDETERIANVGGWEANLETGQFRSSEQMARIFEFPANAKPRVAHFQACFDAQTRKLNARLMRQHIKSGKPWDLEMPMITAQGRKKWVRTVGRIETERGRSARIFGIFQDITLRREMEEELRQGNATMQVVLNNLPCGLSVFDNDLKLVKFNTRFATVLEYPAELLATPGLTIHDLIQFNHARGDYGTETPEAKIEAALDRARSQSSYRVERLRPDGQAVEIRRSPLPGGGFVATYVDVTDARRTEQARLAGERFVRVITDNIPGRVGYWDRKGRCRFANRRYCEFLGLPREEIIGRTAVELFGEEVVAQQQHNAEAVLRGEAQQFEREGRNATTGELVSMLVHYMPDVNEEDGEVRGYFVMSMEVTELKKARDLAAQASLAKSQFLANMSHELRTPMNAILGMLTLLQNTDLSVRQSDYVAKTEGAARALLGLLNDILDFSKVEAGKMMLDPHIFSTDQMLRDLSVILSAGVGEKKLEVLFDVDPAVPSELVGDDMRLRQVLINLCGNAIKFTAEGEVLVQVRVAARRDTEVVLDFSVRDTGIGIAPEHQMRIFEGFTQAESSTMRRFGGTGLGLAICQRLITLMGGELQMESTLGEGSRFHFQLAFAMSSASKPTVAAPGRQSMVLNVLMVDDNPIAREVLAAMAASLGWAADMAASGEEALELLKRSGAGSARFYDAIFVDWRMPGMDGWETILRIRAMLGEAPFPVVVMITAHGREMLARRSAEEQSLLSGFLVKPITTSMLQDVMAEARNENAGAVPSRQAIAWLTPKLKGLRLLLVEDNDNNQQVARELLSAQGAQVDIASDGREGVARVAAAEPPYDAVLMDVQMPVMDGYEATREIRNTLKLSSLPIIAMTANTMTGDREACLDAGMDDHVGKPFDLQELVATLLRHTAVVAPLPVSMSASSPAPASQVQPESATSCGIDFKAAIDRLGGDVGLYLKLVPTFRRGVQELSDRMQPLLAQGQREEARRVMHTLRGLAGTLGADGIVRAAAATEARLKLAAGPEDALAVAAVQDAVARATLEIEQIAAQHGHTLAREPVKA